MKNRGKPSEVIGKIGTSGYLTKTDSAAKRWRRSHQAVFLGPVAVSWGWKWAFRFKLAHSGSSYRTVRARRDDRGCAVSRSAASPRRDWAIVNAWLLMKHRHLHPLIRDAIRRWIAYGKEAT